MINKNTTRSARLHADTETIRKSVKNTNMNPKATPKKFISSTTEKDKLSNNYFLLRSRETQFNHTNKQQIHDQIINSKLLEPLIEENIKRKNNTSKKKVKNSEMNFYEEHFNNEIHKEKKKKETEDEKRINSKKKFGNEKRFSFNKNEYVDDQYQDEYNVSSKNKINLDHSLKNNYLHSVKSTVEVSKENNEKSDLKTNDIIFTILCKNEGNSKNKMTSYFYKSKGKFPSNSGSKSKNKIVTKRRLDNLTVSDEEKFSASSKRKKAIR